MVLKEWGLPCGEALFVSRLPKKCSGGTFPDLYSDGPPTRRRLPAPGCPVIACGPASSLCPSFPAGWTDFLRAPWQPEESWRCVRCQLSPAFAERSIFPRALFPSKGRMSNDGRPLCQSRVKSPPCCGCSCAPAVSPSHAQPSPSGSGEMSGSPPAGRGERGGQIHRPPQKPRGPGPVKTARFIFANTPTHDTLAKR